MMDNKEIDVYLDYFGASKSNIPTARAALVLLLDQCAEDQRQLCANSILDIEDCDDGLVEVGRAIYECLNSTLP